MDKRLTQAVFRVVFSAALIVMAVSIASQAPVHAFDGASSAGVPWYRNPATLISFVALAFSFGTTAVSYHRTKLQDIQASRQELRKMLQRLSAIPRDMLEASKKYAGDAVSIGGVSQLYNQEGTLLSRQAAEIVKNLPQKVVSATECYAIAVAFQSSYNLSAAKDFLEMARAKANNFNDEIGAIRSSANLDFIMGRPQDGRVKYQQALAIFNKYPNYDPFTISSTHISTELFWGGSEAMVGQYRDAMQHADNADRILATLPPSMGTDTLRGQIQQGREQFMRAASVSIPPPVPVQSWLQHPGTPSNSQVPAPAVAQAGTAQQSAFMP